MKGFGQCYGVSKKQGGSCFGLTAPKSLKIYYVYQLGLPQGNTALMLVPETPEVFCKSVA